MSTPTPEPADRDSRGRFTQGNKGGPGNPHARASAQRRAAILEVVSADDIKDIFRHLLLLAKAGNLSAARLLLLYAVGKPEPQVDPDRLDEDEFDVLKGQAADPGEMTEIMASIPGETACKVLEAFLPIRGEHFVGQIEKLGSPVAAASASPVASAPGVCANDSASSASPVASAPGACGNDSVSSRGANATPVAGANAAPPASQLTSPAFLAQAHELLRQAANARAAETPGFTVTKRAQTGEMSVDERQGSPSGKQAPEVGHHPSPGPTR